MKPREEVLAVVLVAVDNLSYCAGNTLQHGDGVEEHFSVLVRQGSDFSSNELDLDLEGQRTRHDRILLRADDATPDLVTEGSLLRVERHHSALCCVQTKSSTFFCSRLKADRGGKTFFYPAAIFWFIFARANDREQGSEVEQGIK